jgi:hypothetical protein
MRILARKRAAPFPGPGLIDGNGSALKVSAMELLDRRLRFLGGSERHEGKASGAARDTVTGEMQVGDGAELAEPRTEGIFGGGEGQIAHIKLRIHG